MLTCPLCKTELPAPAPRCPRCQADLTLLSDFVTDLQALLDKADAHRKAGEIAPAVQAYFEVLEVDLANAEARRALGPVLWAIRCANNYDDRPRQRLKAVGMIALALGVIGWSFGIGVALGLMMPGWFGR
jgi:hypothetical protein